MIVTATFASLSPSFSTYSFANLAVSTRAVDAFKTPELRDKFVAASEVTMQVLQLLLCGVFGSLMGNDVGDPMAIFDALSGFANNDKEKVAQERVDELEKVVCGLQGRVGELERQLRSVQRQDVSGVS